MLPPAFQILALRQSFSFYLRWSAYIFVFLPFIFIWFAHLFRTNSPILALLFVAVAAFSSFRIVLNLYPAFGRGIFTGFSFFIVLEVMYLVQLPIFTQKANEFACRVLDIPDDQCQIEN